MVVPCNSANGKCKNSGKTIKNVFSDFNPLEITALSSTDFRALDSSAEYLKRTPHTQLFLSKFSRIKRKNCRQFGNSNIIDINKCIM